MIGVHTATFVISRNLKNSQNFFSTAIVEKYLILLPIYILIFENNLLNYSDSKITAYRMHRGKRRSVTQDLYIWVPC
jgi:hypothetical protein